MDIFIGLSWIVLPLKMILAGSRNEHYYKNLNGNIQQKEHAHDRTLRHATGN